MYQGAQNWPQCSRPSKQQMERNNNFSEAAGYIFVEAGCTGASLPCWHPMDFWSTWCPPGTPGPFLQSCIPAAGHQSVLEPVLVTPSQMQDFGFSFVVLPEAPIDQFFSSVMSPCIAVKAPVHPMLPSVGYHPHITGVPPIPPPRALMKLLSPIHFITNSQGVSDFSSLTFNHSSPDNFPITLYSTSPHPGYSYVTSLA